MTSPECAIARSIAIATTDPGAYYIILPSYKRGRFPSLIGYCTQSIFNLNIFY